MKKPYTRTLLTQEEWRKQQRNKRWLKTALLGIPLIVAVVSSIAAVFMMLVHVNR